MAYIITCTYLYSTFYEIAEMFHYGFLPLKIEGVFFFNKSEFEQLLLFHKNTWQLFDRVWTSQTHKIWEVVILGCICRFHVAMACIFCRHSRDCPNILSWFSVFTDFKHTSSYCSGACLLKRCRYKPKISTP